MRALILTGLLTIACSVGSKVAVVAGSEDRDAFLTRMDAALQSRSPETILALSDVATWRRSGRPTPEPGGLLLPSAPIARVKQQDGGLAETEALYQDGRGKLWRLRINHDSDLKTWSAVLRRDLCPSSRGMARGLEFERSPAAAPEPQHTWTPLECWPLPQ